jgi:hypothetical protein
MPTTNAPAQQRRVFRGRGGPKDGRLPPKKKKTLAVRYVAGSKYPLPPPSSQDDDNDDNDDHDDGEEKVDSAAPVSSAVDADDEQKEEEENGLEGAVVAIIMLEQQEEEKPGDEQCAMIELRHLRQRINNIRQSMTLSKGKNGEKKHHCAAPSSSSTSIQHYSANVLNAILNAVVEWHAIYTRYYYCYDDHHHPDEDDSAGPALPSSQSLSSDAPPPPPPRPSEQRAVVVVREMGDQVFALIQQGLQCGPLAGSKPGYFKRCGGATAGLVHAFLIRVIEYLPLTSSSSSSFDFWSERQRSTLALWMAQAEKAASAHQEPSRSVQKKMSSGRR